MRICLDTSGATRVNDTWPYLVFFSATSTFQWSAIVKRVSRDGYLTRSLCRREQKPRSILHNIVWYNCNHKVLGVYEYSSLRRPASPVRLFVRVIRPPLGWHKSTLFRSDYRAKPRYRVTGDSNVILERVEKNNTRESTGQCALAGIGQWTVAVGHDLARRRPFRLEVTLRERQEHRRTHCAFVYVLRLEKNDRFSRALVNKTCSGSFPIVYDMRAYIIFMFVSYTLHVL